MDTRHVLCASAASASAVRLVIFGPAAPDILGLLPCLVVEGLVTDCPDSCGIGRPLTAVANVWHPSHPRRRIRVFCFLEFCYYCRYLLLVCIMCMFICGNSR